MMKLAFGAEQLDQYSMRAQSLPVAAFTQQRMINLLVVL